MPLVVWFFPTIGLEYHLLFIGCRDLDFFPGPSGSLGFGSGGLFTWSHAFLLTKRGASEKLGILEVGILIRVLSSAVQNCDQSSYCHTARGLVDCPREPLGLSDTDSTGFPLALELASVCCLLGLCYSKRGV